MTNSGVKLNEFDIGALVDIRQEFKMQREAIQQITILRVGNGFADQIMYITTVPHCKKPFIFLTGMH